MTLDVRLAFAYAHFNDARLHYTYARSCKYLKQAASKSSIQLFLALALEANFGGTSIHLVTQRFSLPLASPMATNEDAL